MPTGKRQTRKTPRRKAPAKKAPEATKPPVVKQESPKLDVDSLISPTWKNWAHELNEDIGNRGIEHWASFDKIIRNISVGDSVKYGTYASRCREFIWDQKVPAKVVEFGAGYGGMAEFWPEVPIVNIDLAPMLEIQKYVLANHQALSRMSFIETKDIPLVDFSGAMFFSAYGFTETTPGLWDYMIAEVFPKCQSIYLIGSQGWSEDGIQRWPWEKLETILDATFNEEPTLGGVPGKEICGFIR